MFEYILRLLDNNINGHPIEFEHEVEFVRNMLKNGQGYLTKKTVDCPYVKIVFFDELYKGE